MGNLFRRLNYATTALVLVGMSLLVLPAHAATTQPLSNEFNLLVTPSPLVTTVKPGMPSEIELKIRNGSVNAETLKIEPRNFTFDSKSGKVALEDTAKADVGEWVGFSNPTFTVKPGEWFTQKVRLSFPKEAGFSYSFALVISRKNTPAPVSGGRLIQGSVAVFTLVNVDRPGATRKLEVPSFTTTKSVYEYLPSELHVRFKNTGNSIVQPYGSVFIQRGSKDKIPLATLAVNEGHGYILPGTERTFATSWKQGFPVYSTTVQPSGTQKQQLNWDWSKIGQFRIGRYTAKLVAVYSDGQRDVPIEQEITFWVLPWKILLGLLVIVVFTGFGAWSFIQRALRAGRRRGSSNDYRRR
jgi:hypothetical protein